MVRAADEAKVYDRLARSYHANATSPFARGVDLPLRRDVRRILARWSKERSARRRVVMDFGCGIGEALALVAGKVGLAAGIDFSRGMLTVSRERLRRMGVDAGVLDGRSGLRSLRRLVEASRNGTPTTVLAMGNLSRLKALEDACDLALAIHSVTGSSRTRAHRIFGEVVSSVRPGGVLIALFASRDALEYLSALHRRHRRDRNLGGEVDFERGVFVDDEGDGVAVFTARDVERMSKERSLRVLRLEKARYPWTLMRYHGWGYYPRSPRLWDWYLVARKTKARASRSAEAPPM